MLLDPLAAVVANLGYTQYNQTTSGYLLKDINNTTLFFVIVICHYYQFIGIKHSTRVCIYAVKSLNVLLPLLYVPEFDNPL
jgi:hypothetical protein